MPLIVKGCSNVIVSCRERMVMISYPSESRIPLAVHVALNIVRRPKTTPIHELERYMRCKDRSELTGRPFKRSHLVALRTTKIIANDPPSTWWPGDGAA